MVRCDARYRAVRGGACSRARITQLGTPNRPEGGDQPAMARASSTTRHERRLVATLFNRRRKDDHRRRAAGIGRDRTTRGRARAHLAVEMRERLSALAPRDSVAQMRPRVITLSLGVPCKAPPGAPRVQSSRLLWAANRLVPWLAAAVSAARRLTTSSCSPWTRGTSQACRR